MSKTTLHPKPPSMSPGEHSKWKPCRLCTTKWVTAELKFDSGSVEPTVDETLTGATSENTGVVTEVEDLISGSWAGGDAAGYLHMDTLVGDDPEQYSIFSDNELINGGTAGDNCLTVDGQGNVKIWAILWPKRMLTKFRGFYYCPEHAKFRMRPILRDEDKLIIKEDERGKE